MNPNNFAKGREAEKWLHAIFKNNRFSVVDLGAVSDDAPFRFPHAMFQGDAIILPDMLVSRDGASTWVECKRKAPTDHGYFGMRAENFLDASTLLKESGIGYAVAVYDEAAAATANDNLSPWLICRPFEPRWVGDNGVYHKGEFSYIRKSCFRPLLRCLALQRQ